MSIRAIELASQSVPVSSDLQGLNEAQKQKLEFKIQMLSQKTLLRVYIPEKKEVKKHTINRYKNNYIRNLHGTNYYYPTTSKSVKKAD